MLAVIPMLATFPVFPVEVAARAVVVIVSFMSFVPARSVELVPGTVGVVPPLAAISWVSHDVLLSAIPRRYIVMWRLSTIYREPTCGGSPEA
jgi:hypothetical protein